MYSVYTRVQMVCPLLGGLSSFGVSFIGGFTVQKSPTRYAARFTASQPTSQTETHASSHFQYHSDYVCVCGGGQRLRFQVMIRMNSEMFLSACPV